MKNRKIILGVIIALICILVIIILVSTVSFGGKGKETEQGKKEEKIVVNYTGDITVDKSREEIVTTQTHDGAKGEFTIEGAQEGDSVTFTYNVVNKTKNTAVILDPPALVTEANNDYYTMISFSSEEALKADGGKGTQTIVIQVAQNPDEANKKITVNLDLTAQAAK